MLVDSSKFSNASHVIYVHGNDLHTIVTDTGLSTEVREQLLQGKARLICVDPKLLSY